MGTGPSTSKWIKIHLGLLTNSPAVAPLPYLPLPTI
jgi:hypothetical protein